MLVCLAAMCSHPSRGAVTPELQRAVRQGTFEVVLKKPTSDSLKYEKPLPLDLLPFKERTDTYRSVGTAFALDGNTYVTAAHVLILAVNSQYGAPLVRAADGQVYAIKSILKFSAHEDFVVFSLASDLAPRGLETNRTPNIDDPVMAVGNALGEGIVIRDGLYTSQTPEVQDGRWQWLRFSAAASPGNSGGPLLDGVGRVIGLIEAKSPNENLNYALPIANILDAPVGKARIDVRSMTALPFLQGKDTYNLKDQFDLPLDWPTFQRSYLEVMERHGRAARKQLLTAYAGTLFPKGPGTETVFYEARTSVRAPGVLVQQPDGQWTIQVAQFDYSDLPQDGRVGHALAVSGVTLLRLVRGDEAADDAFYADSNTFMDLALHTLDLRRQVGTDSVRVISLGPALPESLLIDRYQRKWQQRVWALPYMDAYLVGLLLPTPDGYVALLTYALSPFISEAQDNLTLLADQVTTPYEGTLGQWQAFLRRRALLPRSLEHVALASAPVWRLTTGRFESAIPATVIALDSHSRVLLDMGFVPAGTRIAWEPVGAWWYRDSQEKAYVGLWRQPRPPASAKHELRDAFADLEMRRSPYDGVPVRSASDAYTLSTSIQAPGTATGTASSDVVYGLVLQSDRQALPARMGLLGQSLREATRVIEHGVGPDAALLPIPDLSSGFDKELDRLRQQIAEHDEQIGKDIRGRTMSRDFDDYLISLVRQAVGGDAAGLTPSAYYSEWSRRAGALQMYWNQAPYVEHNREVWPDFLKHNRLPDDTPHSQRVLDAENALKSELGSNAPGPGWADRARELTQAYVAERGKLAESIKRDANTLFHSRKASCPQPAPTGSGKDRPAVQSPTHSVEEYYPPAARRLGLEGSVVLALRVDRTGCATAAAVVGSSGLDSLDQAALQFFETLTFLPAERGGQRIDSETPLKIAFALADLPGSAPEIGPAPAANKELRR